RVPGTGHRTRAWPSNAPDRPNRHGKRAVPKCREMEITFLCGSALGEAADPESATGFFAWPVTCAWRINRIKLLSEFGTSLDSASATGTNRDQLVMPFLPQAVPAGALPAPHAFDGPL